MYPKGKGSQMPSDTQAKDKLALYVYDYLMQIGATKSAQTFINEIRFDMKQFQLNEAPGFLLSWWCVFWDLYCAAPERRDLPSNEYSNEAKAFHDYGFINATGYQLQNGITNSMSNNPLTQISPQDIQNSILQQNQQQQQNPFFSPNAQQPTQTNQILLPNQAYRYPPRPMRVASNTDYNGPNNVVPQMNMDPSRASPNINNISRLTPPGARLQQQQQGPGIQNAQQGQLSQTPPAPQRQQSLNSIPQTPANTSSMSPMQLNQNVQQTQQRWPPVVGPPQTPQQNSSNQQPNPNFSSSSPAPYTTTPQHGPGTPQIIQSPQDTNNEINYGIMKTTSMVSTTGPTSSSSSSGPINFHDSNMQHINSSINPDLSHHNQHINGDLIDSLKNSPISNLANSRLNQDEHQNNTDINTTYTNFGDGSVSLY